MTKRCRPSQTRRRPRRGTRRPRPRRRPDMGKLTDDEAEALKKLEAKRDAKDDPGDDDVEWWEHPDGSKGGRMRAHRARSHGPDWLRGMLEDKSKDKDAGDGDDAGDGSGKDEPAAGVRRFQRRVS